MRLVVLSLLCCSISCSSSSSRSVVGSGGADAGGGSAGSAAAAGGGGVAGSGGSAGGGGATGGASGSGGGAGTASSQFAQEVTASKPSAWWRFEEPSGSTVTDESGSFVGTLGGTSGSVTLGAVGVTTGSKALKLSAEDAVVDFGDNFDFDGASLLTIEMFVNPANFDQSPNLLTKYEPSNASGWATYVGSAGLNGGLRVTVFDNGQVKDLSGLLVSANTWSYVAYTYDATNLCTYLGVSGGSLLDEKCSAETTPASIPNTPASMKLGTGFQGRVDELAIYAKRLPKAELQKHYAAALADGF